MSEEIRENTEKTGDEIQYQERKRLLFFGLPWTFTKYTITEDMLTIDEGLFTVEENDCYMYKVQDVKLTASVMERIFGLGTITCYTGDVTNKELKLIHIKHAKEIKGYLLKASEEARLKRRTLHTQDIGVDMDEDEL
ncbi:MAG: PH domain-containing protein [Clostridiales bacterium]|nr:PH domain-containing protein [Roseburia sp.]MDD7638399.1 PH domain-containing protein [Clostridiales bacterium]MDY4112141.1 PH domain-containing protein [Roseburia sp.]